MQLLCHNGMEVYCRSWGLVIGPPTFPPLPLLPYPSSFPNLGSRRRSCSACCWVRSVAFGILSHSVLWFDPLPVLNLQEDQKKTSRAWLEGSSSQVQKVFWGPWRLHMSPLSLKPPPEVTRLSGCVWRSYCIPPIASFIHGFQYPMKSLWQIPKPFLYLETLGNPFIWILLFPSLKSASSGWEILSWCRKMQREGQISRNPPLVKTNFIC